MTGALAPLPLRLGTDGRYCWTPEAHAQICASLAAVVRTAPLAMVTVQQTGASAATVLRAQMMGGVGPAHEPSLTVYGSSGIVLVSWPAQITDPFGESYPFNVRHATVTPAGSPAVIAVAGISTPHEVVVRTFNWSGVAINATWTLVVY